MRHGWKLLAALVSMTGSGLAFAGAAHAQTTLRYKHKEGDRLEHVIDQGQKTTLKVKGKDLETKAMMVMKLMRETLKVDDRGNARIKVTVGHVKLSLDGPFGKVELDSKDTPEPEDPNVAGHLVESTAETHMELEGEGGGMMLEMKIVQTTRTRVRDMLEKPEAPR